MIELRFHEELYDGFAVDEAVKAYDAFMTAELTREPHGYVVRVTASQSALDQAIDEATIAAELANYALGRTIERSRGAEGAGAPGAGAGAPPAEEAAR
ncbi:MAG: hypothetical protein IT372_31345 [Polyangiaceae bacterium]|nr:hypothetical protein [Polyangiaceae bacterium]